jgi:hypothetical protein
VPDRPNFIVSLGANEKIVGGGKDDQLGARGRDDTIVAGDGGHELLHGGPHGTVVVGGSGHDLVIDNQPDTTIDVKSPGDEVILTGRDDHVVCSGDSFHDQIYDNRSDTVNTTCHKDHDPVRPDSQAVAAAARVASANPARGAGGPVAHAAAVFGSGTDSDPYVAPCTTVTSYGCDVEFPPRTLSGLWVSEGVPAYECPGNHPFLFNANYAPFGTVLPVGVEVTGLGPIGVHITNTLQPTVTPVQGMPGLGVFTERGTSTEFSSATSWSLGTNSYRMILHCTDTGYVGPLLAFDAWSVGRGADYQPRPQLARLGVWTGRAPARATHRADRLGPA